VSQFGRDFHGKVVTFGIQKPADVRAENIQLLGLDGSRFTLAAGGCREQVSLPLVGEHNVYNAIAAAAVALEHGVTPSEAAAALGTLRAAEKRGQVLEVARVTVLNDCYNSNPKALNAMIDALAEVKA